LQDLVKNNSDFADQVHLDTGAEAAKTRPLNVYMGLLDGTQDQKEWYPTFKEAYQNVRKLYHTHEMSVRGASRFFWDTEEYRSEVQLDNCFKHVVIPAIREITSRRKGRWIGPTGLGTAFSSCRNCRFKAPCQLVMSGADYKEILHEEYQLRDVYRSDKTDKMKKEAK